MLNKLRNIFSKSDKTDASEFVTDDLQLAQAALMFHVIAADGIVHQQEKDRLHAILENRHGLSGEQASALIDEARQADSEAIDLYAFTSTLKRQLEHEQRLDLIENLWEMVYADGELHELEDNVVWRIAELLAIDKRERMALKRKVRDKMNAET